jgi:hypothetical protein
VSHWISDPTVSAPERQIQNLRMALDRKAPTDRTRIAYSVLLISQHQEDKEFVQEFLTGLPCRLEWPSWWAAAMRTNLPISTWEQVLSRLAHPPHLIVISRLADERLWAAVLNQCGFDVLAKPLARDEVLELKNPILVALSTIGHVKLIRVFLSALLKSHGPSPLLAITSNPSAGMVKQQHTEAVCQDIQYRFNYQSGAAASSDRIGQMMRRSTH